MSEKVIWVQVYLQSRQCSDDHAQASKNADNAVEKCKSLDG